MSHNVRLNNVKFSSLSVLKGAIEEMNREGANVELVTGDNLVARISGAGARDVPCDALIRCLDGRWDVALHRNEQGDYIPETESMFNHKHLSVQNYGRSATPVEGCNVDYGGIQIGRLTQRYALIAAEANAAKSGFSTSRSYDENKRQYVLEVNAG